MGKILKNIFAFYNGLKQCIKFSVFRDGICIGKWMRVFKGCELKLYRGSKAAFGDNIKIDKYAEISVSKNANLRIGNRVGIGAYSMIVCHDHIEIGDNTLLAPSVYIYDHDHVFDSQNGVRSKEYNTSPVYIGKNCWIGANTIILRGTRIGNNCVIGAGSILKGIYPDGSIIIQKKETIIKEIR